MKFFKSANVPIYKRRLKIGLWLAYIEFLGYHIYWAYFGITTILTTVVLYISIGLFCSLVLGICKRFNWAKPEQVLNLRILTYTGLVALFVLELFLKYGLQWQATYFEKGGQFYNFSPYRSVLYRNYRKETDCLNGNCWLVNQTPFKFYYDKKTEFNYLHRFNSIGLPDKEPATLADCPQLIVGLGDSFTEGVGTHQDSTWLKEMERNLNQKNKGANPVCTLNGGISGNDIVYAYQSFIETMLPYHPKMVLLAINPSDIGDIVIRGGAERFKPGGNVQYRKPPPWEMLCETSIIFRHFIHDVLRYYTTYYYKEKEYAAECEKAKVIIEQYVYKFNQLAAENNFKLVVIFHPYFDEVMNGWQRLDSVYLNTSRDTSIHIINMFDEFLNAPQINQQPEKAASLYWPIDGHNNPAGYRLWGEIVADCLQSYGLTDTAKTTR